MLNVNGLNYLPNNRNQEDIDNVNWDLMEISKIDDKIIKRLLDKINSGISDDFYISLESLIQIGEKAKPALISFIKNNKINSNTKIILYFIIDYIENKGTDYPLVFKLYNPDFVVRARTIMELEDSDYSDYLEYILPLIEDPDDSVRWAIIKYLSSNNLIDNPLVRGKLNSHITNELNPVIKSKIKDIL
ncbi:MAG: hypothetical protein GF317_10785 [Candidatus Lokiarchaeota archaeon]|nr:hypothetical protein [Candidatus Lokiarchaeota archaeon]MBD3200147.1 hypothetical protein [Candidatus Lokiarchaeota archaeon]